MGLTKIRPVRSLWNGTSWVYVKRWENFTRSERNRWREKNPNAEHDPPAKAEVVVGKI